METLEIKNVIELKSPDKKPVGDVSILLVDDELRNLDVLDSILASPELRLVRAQTAEDALLALVHDEFACIVLDVQMPSMSGLELARLIKTRKRSQHIPVIFLTAYFLEEKDILQGYGAGAVDYLTKPINPQILKSKVGVFVDLFRTTHALAAANNSLEQEISQRKKAEAALREMNNELEMRVEERTADLSLTEQRYRQLVQSLPAAVYTTDAEGRVTLFNEAAAILWGRRPEIGKDLWCGSYKIFNPDGTDLPLDECPMAVTLKQGHAVRGREIVIERPDGTRRNILPYPEPIFNASGKIVGAVNMLLDITERNLAQLVAQRFAAIVESSDDAIIGKDINGFINSWNHGAERIFQYTADEIVGKHITTLIPPERHNEEEEILGKIRQGESVRHYETVRQRKDGSFINVSLTISPIKDASEKIIGASKIARDITERKRAEKDLEKAHKELLAASRAKDDFLAVLSHELRTPLNPVLLIASDAANNHELPPRTRTDFDTIRKNIELEARLIDDLLDLTRITRGKVILDKHFLDVHRILEDAIAKVRDEMNQKQIAFKMDLKVAQHMVFADAVRLQQIFWNLLKNAVKFTPKGGQVTIETDAGENKLAIKITDTGIGMTTDEAGHAFTAFSQGSHTSDGNGHRFGGLGLGLAISQKLAEFHSGKILATSEGRNKGSTFIVELPLAQAAGKNGDVIANPPAASSPGLPTKANGIRVLLVEDHEPTRTALTQLLMRRSYKVISAASVAEARILAGAQNFNIVISDIGLPDGNGYELMAELKKNGAVKGIALTGYGTEQDVARSRAAGFVTHLTKPVGIQSLEAALNAATDNVF
jgi:PAS domain S-box-containing protein